jgi:hypothetical protein
MKKTISPESTPRHKERKTRFAGMRLGLLAVAICGAVVTAVTLSSCGEDSITGVSRDALNMASSSNSQANSPNSQANSLISFPTIHELKTELDLTPQQMSGVAPALAQFRVELMKASRGQEPAGVEIESLVDFLIRVSDVLSAEQFNSLAQFLVQEVPVIEQAINAQTLFFITPEMVQEFAQQNNLTSTQLDDLLQAVETANEAYANLQMQILEGQISGQAITTQAITIQSQFIASVQGILGPLYTNFTTFVQQERTATINTTLQNLSTRVNQEFQLLTQLLDLNAQQQTQIQTSLQTALFNYQTLLTNINLGTVTFDQALAQSTQIVLSLNTAIQSSLTPEQLARWNAISFLFTQPFGILFI